MTDPEDAIVLGPYDPSGSSSGRGEDWTFDLLFDDGGVAWFVASGGFTEAERMPISGGLIRPPVGTIGHDWLCTGPDATWGVVSGDLEPDESGTHCPSSRGCELKLILMEPSWLRCAGATSSGSLSLTPASGGFAVASTLPELDGLVMTLSSGPWIDTTLRFTPVPRSNEFHGDENDDYLQMHYETELITEEGQPDMEWVMSDISILFRRGRLGASQLICATGGTYRVSVGEDVTQSVELTGVSEIMSCPGEPVGQPIVIDMEE